MKKFLAILVIGAMALSLISFAAAEGETIVYWSMESTEPQGQAIQRP